MLALNWGKNMAKNILLVDDENETSTVFETGLAQAGHKVVVAADGKTAIMHATSAPFDLILLDQMMPDMSGNDVLRELKSNEATKNIPIAMLSNFGHDEMVKEALTIGANDYILKYQISPQDLVEKVKILVGE